MSARPPLFVHRVRLRDFRGYGDFDLEVPGEPCVVLLSGPNGLGKTSLFEAIEWALTGAVRRLDKLSESERGTSPRDLARRAKGVDQFQVDVSFRDSEGTPTVVTRMQVLTHRGGSVADSIGTNVSTVAELLRSDDDRWNVTGENVAGYLHLTHLHAQVASLRLVTSSAKERWVRVSPLVGADRFDRVRKNLVNTKKALTELSDEHRRAQDEARGKREQWQALLQRAAKLRQAVAAIHDALSPCEAVAKLRALLNDLRVPWPEASDRSQDEMATAQETLLRAREAIENSRQLMDGAVDRLGGLRALPRRWLDLSAQRERVGSQRAALEAEAATAEQSLEAASATAKETERANQEAQARRESAAKHQEVLLRAAQDRGALAPAEHELGLAEAALKDAENARDEAERAEGQCREVLARHEEASRARARIHDEIEALERARAALDAKAALSKSLGTEEAGRSGLATALQAARASEEKAARELEAREASVREAEHIFELQRTASAKLHDAVAWIAEQLRDEDSRCPVCSTTFDAGKLKLVAQQSLASLDPHLAAAEAALRQAKDNREFARQNMKRVLQERRETEAQLAAVDDTIKEIGLRIRELSSTPFVPVSPMEQAVRELEDVRKDKQLELKQIEADWSARPPLASLRKALADATARTAERRRALDAAQAVRNSRDTRVSMIRARVEQLRSENPSLPDDDGLDGALAAAAAELSAADDAAAAAKQEHATAEAARQAAENAVASLAEQARMLGREEGEIDRTLGGLQRQWKAVNLPDAISETALDERMAQAVADRQACSRALATVERIASGLARWQEADELHVVEQQIQVETAGAGIETHTRALEEAERQAVADFEAAQRARTAADELGDAFQHVATEFGERALKPCGDLFRRYLRALVHDERFHSIEISYEAAARAAALQFNLDLGGSATQAEFILSEGQLGEISLATMLAASSTFPWSRWSALLLDDPTQYNDLIHATALFDVLRNLVLWEGYQLFISAHDSGQAAFLRQKLVSLGIPGVECRYVGQGPDGVDVEIVPFERRRDAAERRH